MSNISQYRDAQSHRLETATLAAGIREPEVPKPLVHELDNLRRSISSLEQVVEVLESRLGPVMSVLGGRAPVCGEKGERVDTNSIDIDPRGPLLKDVGECDARIMRLTAEISDLMLRLEV